MKKKNAIRKLRDRLMYNQQEFAKLMGVDTATISRWENDWQRPKAVHMRRMDRLSKNNGTK
tara:strand:- start:594 stop:776 length:183 start_codon:yes stop_codon:yes gene_type:complete